MPNKKINDLVSAISLQDTMQLETDIAGVTSNKVTYAQIKDNIEQTIQNKDNNFLVKQTYQTHPSIVDDVDITDKKYVDDTYAPVATLGDLEEVSSSVLTVTGGVGAVIGTGTSIEVSKAETAADGYLSSTDWNTFNDKQSTITTGDLAEDTSNVLSIIGGSDAVIGSGASIEVSKSTASTDGYLSYPDWIIFNNKQEKLWARSSDTLTPTTVTDNIVTEGDVTANDAFLDTINSNISDMNADATTPSGFVTDSDTTMTFDDATRMFVITPIGSEFVFWQTGKRFVKTQVIHSLILSSGEGQRVIYYDGGALRELYPYTDQGFVDIILNRVLVAILYVDATNSKHILFNERHSCRLSNVAHLRLHTQPGAIYVSGLALSGFDVDGSGDINSNAQFVIESGRMADEDIDITTNQNLSTVGTRVMYRDGSNWRWEYNLGFNLINTGTGRLAWNDNGTLHEVDNRDFVNMHVFAWNEYNGDTVVILGQAEYDTKRAARAGANKEISDLLLSGLPSPEMVPIATVIFQTSDAYTNTVKARAVTTDEGLDYVDWRNSVLSPSSGATDHGNLGGLTDDDHFQYLLLQGRIDGQTIIGGTEAGNNLELQTTGDVTKGSYIFTDLNEGLMYCSSTSSVSTRLIADGINTNVDYGINESADIKINTNYDVTFDYVTIGRGAAGVDYTITFNGESNDGILKWDEDLALFDFNDSIKISTTIDPSISFGLDYGLLKFDSPAGELTLQCYSDISVIIDSTNTSSTSTFSVKHDSSNPLAATQLFSISESGAAFIGIEDGADEGKLIIYAQGGTSAEGGEIQLHFSPDYDGTYEHYRIDAYKNDLRFGRSGETTITFKDIGDIYMRDGVAFRVNDTTGSLTIDSNDAITNIINKDGGTGNFTIANASATLFTVTSGGDAYVNDTLYVLGYAAKTYSFGYLNSAGNTGTSSGTNAYSIISTYRIAAQEFNAVSDARIKNITTRLDSGDSLSIINNLAATKYTYKDYKSMGSDEHIGFIAQELENYIPDAVTQRENYTPDIYSFTTSTSYDEIKKELVIELASDHNLAVGDSVMLMLEDDKATCEVLKIVSTISFVVSAECHCDQTDPIFVYGKEVNDFRNINYDSVLTVAVSAIQELSSKVASLEARLTALESK